jgi:hypothetical protein
MVVLSEFYFIWFQSCLWRGVSPNSNASEFLEFLVVQLVLRVDVQVAMWSVIRESWE